MTIDHELLRRVRMILAVDPDCILGQVMVSMDEVIDELLQQRMRAENAEYELKELRKQILSDDDSLTP
jgi:hypothetical protein